MTATAAGPPVVGTTRRALTRSLGGSTAAAVLGYGCNLVLVPALLHGIGPVLYGAWATIASLLAVGGLADAGVRTEIVRRVGIAKGGGDDAEVVSTVHRGVSMLTMLAAALAAAGAVTAPLMRAFAFPGGIPGYSGASVDWLIRATFLVLAVEVVANGHFAVLRGLQRADAESAALAVSMPVGVTTTIAGVALGWGLWALLAGSVAQLGVQVIVQALATRRLVPSLRFRLARIDRATAKGFAALGGLALISQLGDVIDTQWDKVVLSRYVGSAAVASFQIGTTLVLQAKALALIPVAPMLVAVAELGRAESGRLAALCRRLAQVGAVAAGTVLGAVFVFAPAFVRLWLGPGASPQIADACRIFTVAIAINLWCAPLAFRALGSGWHRLTAIGSAVNIGVNGLASFVLAVHVGYRGPVIGSVLGNAAAAAVFVALMKRRTPGETWEWPAVTPWLAAAALAVAAVGLHADAVSSWPAFVLAGVLWCGLGGATIALVAGLRSGLRLPIGQG